MAQPIRASFEMIVSHRQDGRAWFQLAENPRVYVLGYESLSMQGRALNRIAAFVEWREAPKDRVLDDRALAEMMARTSENPEVLFFGHDYRATDLARFFTAARRSGIILNDAEEALKNGLLRQDFLQVGQDEFVPVPPTKVLIAIPGEQADQPETPQNESITPRMRRTILSHELSHGEFFTNPDYARYCQDFWRNILSSSQREAFTRFLSSAQHYDTQDESLLINEFQAYLAYSGTDGIFFRDDAVSGMTPLAMKKLRRRFLERSPALFTPVLGSQAGKATAIQANQ